MGNKQNNEFYCYKLGMVKCSICNKLKNANDITKNLICLNCYEEFKHEIERGIL